MSTVFNVGDPVIVIDATTKDEAYLVGARGTVIRVRSAEDVRFPIRVQFDDGSHDGFLVFELDIDEERLE